MMNTNESGRSMVEMLGVLAIIGVLSIGGIAGYTQSMKKYRVNEAVNAVTMGAVMCATNQKQGLSTLSKDGIVTMDGCTGDTVDFTLNPAVDEDAFIEALSGNGVVTNKSYNAMGTTSGSTGSTGGGTSTSAAAIQ